MSRTRRAVMILFVTGLILMVLFPPIAPTFSYRPGPLPSEPFKVVEGVLPERNKTASELREEAHAGLTRDQAPPARYRFIAIPPLIGTSSETVDYGSNIMVVATYGVAWVLFIRNVLVLLLVSTAAFLIAPRQ